MENFLLILMGFITGLIDSVVGGGGLVSLPTLSVFLGPGVQSIATNKILGVTGAFIALLVYAKKGHLRVKEALFYCFFASAGSFAGSSFSPLLDKEFFRYLLIFTCPIILYIILFKDKFLQDKKIERINHSLLLTCAFFSGFYDGFFGPGGGTFMFLGLYVVAGYPLLNAIAISKLANTSSATIALVNFSRMDVINWKIGLIMAIGMSFGAFVGANVATKHAAKIMRPLLIGIVSLLLIKLIFNY